MFPRDIEKTLEPYFESKQALFILGARQVGKTSLLQRLINRFPEGQTFYLDLERVSDKRVLEEGPQSFLNYLEFQGLDLGVKNYIFIDEIQYFEDFSKFIKILVDHHSDSIKLFLSGSSSAQIKTKFKESLVGRKYVFNLFPLTFREFLVFKERQSLADKLNKLFYEWTSDDLRFARDELISLLHEYVIFGGYPELAKIGEKKKKIRHLNEIIDAYVVKDIRSIFTVRNIDKFNHLVRFLALNFTQLFSVNSTSTEVGLFRETVESYLGILEDTFVLRRLRPYHRNKSTELKKVPKVFFLDNGLRNALVNNFSPLDLRNDGGALLENHVFCQLYKNLSETQTLHFWRTTNKQEVDFVVEQGEILRPLEVRTSKGTRNHLSLFMDSYRPDTGFLVSLRNGFDARENTTVLPLYLVQ